ncbi:MAG TPA: TonB-dependent receptor [Bacteroidales bacterium]|nr:TonB-dependent receptor [Bacteroidales bacterium]HPS71560.1 TonB-dependent receptor [Bacteroidales bacterium]
MKKIILMIAFVCAIWYTNAQNKISGIITDQDKKPLYGAIVYIPELNKSTISDSKGYFEINHIPNGDLKIQCSYVGYANYIQTIHFQGETVKHNIEMFHTAIAVEEIVVSGGYRSTQHENAAKIDILKLDPLSNKITPNFAELIAQVPGVDMISKGNGVSKPVIRGLSMNEILILNNGVRFENYQYSSHHPLGIDEFGISEVEVIKGPASLIYGSDAIGGVINFIKEKPAPVGTVIGDYNLQLFSNSLGITQNLGIKGSSKHFFGGIRFGHKNNADYLQGGGSFVPNTRFNEYSVKANIGLTGKIGVFKLFYDFNNQKLGLAEEEAIEAIYTRGWNTEIWYQRLNTHLLSSQNKLFLGKFILDVNAAFQQTELMHAEDLSIVEIEMQLRTLTYDVKLKLPSSSKSEYIIGVQGLNQSNLNINEREVQLLPDAKTINNSLYALIQHTFFKNLTIQAGVRYDFKKITSQAVGAINDSTTYRAPLNLSYGSFSGSLGATYHLNENLLLRGNVASAYRTPNLAELTSKGQHELRYEIGDYHLVPEQSLEGDLSMHYHIQNLSIDVAGFYNYIQNYIYIAPTGNTTSDGIPIYQYKQATAYLYGGETGFHFHPKNAKWLCFEGSYAMVIGRQMDGSYLPFIPAHKIKFEIRVEKEKWWKVVQPFVALNNNNIFAQNRPAPDEEATKGYALFDVSLGGQVKIKNQLISVAFSVNNIMDTKYMDHLSTLREVNMFNPGRNFVLTVKIPFQLK